MHDAIDVPELGSLILTHSWNGEIKGLKSWPADERPPVGPPFYCFRIMVGLAFLMLFIVFAGQTLRVRGSLYGSGWFLRLCQYAAPIGFFAVVAGWITTEVGRQPWTVYGLLRTANSVTPSLTGAQVAVSLACYALVYLVMYPTGIAFMVGLVRQGPPEGEIEPKPIEGGLPDQPFESAARLTPEK